MSAAYVTVLLHGTEFRLHYEMEPADPRSWQWWEQPYMVGVFVGESADLYEHLSQKTRDELEVLLAPAIQRLEFDRAYDAAAEAA